MKHGALLIALIALTAPARGGSGTSKSSGNGGAMSGGARAGGAGAGGGSGGTTGGAGGAVAGSGGRKTQLPVILSFTATPANLASAGDATLTWQVQNAVSLSINQGIGLVTGTSVATTVSATTIFTLTASNASGSTTATTAAVVGVNPSADKIGRFAAMVSPPTANPSSRPRRCVWWRSAGIRTCTPTTPT